MTTEKDETFTILVKGKPLATVKAHLIHTFLSVESFSIHLYTLLLLFLLLYLLCFCLIFICFFDSIVAVCGGLLLLRNLATTRFVNYKLQPANL